MSDTQLKDLLDEAITYKNPKDRETKSDRFKVRQFNYSHTQPPPAYLPAHLRLNRKGHFYVQIVCGRGLKYT